MTKTKQKTKKIVSKRFKITKNGKVMRGQSNKRHLNTHKSRKRKRRLTGMVKTNKTYADKIKKLMGK